MWLRHIDLVLTVFPVCSYGLFTTRSFAFEGQKRVRQLSVCVRAHMSIGQRCEQR